MGVNFITASTTLALDTNIFIYAYERSDNLGESARAILGEIRERNPKVFISVIVFEEFLIKIYKQKLEKNLADYESFITGGEAFTVVDVDKQIARVAAKIRADYLSVRAPDAIHIACAIEMGAKVFITTDKRLPRKIGKLAIKVL